MAATCVIACFIKMMGFSCCSVLTGLCACVCALSAEVSYHSKKLSCRKCSPLFRQHLLMRKCCSICSLWSNSTPFEVLMIPKPAATPLGYCWGKKKKIVRDSMTGSTCSVVVRGGFGAPYNVSRKIKLPKSMVYKILRCSCYLAALKNIA